MYSSKELYHDSHHKQHRAQCRVTHTPDVPQRHLQALRRERRAQQPHVPWFVLTLLDPPIRRIPQTLHPDTISPVLDPLGFHHGGTE